MKVILLQNIKGVGQIGDIKDVSDGYASNFLFPKKMARIATAGAEKEAQSLMKKRQVVAQKESEKTNAAVTALAAAHVEISKKASDAGTLFSSVSKEEIAKEASKLSGFKIDKSMIDLGEQGEHIKLVGEHVATINLGTDLKAELRITIKAQ